jgi:hypothetical protein
MCFMKSMRSIEMGKKTRPRIFIVFLYRGCATCLKKVVVNFIVLPYAIKNKASHTARIYWCEILKNKV